MSTIILMLIAAVAVCFLISYFRLDEEVQPATVRIFDFTFKDDKRNTFVVTAACASDAIQLLIEYHGLTRWYVDNHVFLANAKKVF